MTDKQKTIAWVIGLAALCSVVVACAGFDSGDIIRVKTPRPIQQQHGLKSTVSLNEAASEYEAWLEDVQRTGAEWRMNIEQGEEMRTMLHQLTLTGLDAVGPTVAGVPMLAPLLPFGAGIAGLLFGQRRLRREKESSFKAGIREGTEVGGGAS